MVEQYSKESQRSIFPVTLILLGSAFISIGPFFVEFSSAHAITVTFYRLLISTIFFSALNFYRKEKINPKIFIFCLPAGLTLAIDLFTWNQSVLYIGSGLATLLSNLEVIFLALLGYFMFKEKIHPLFFGMCLLILGGIYCLTCPYYSNISTKTILGILFALGASFVYSIYLTLLKLVGSKYSEVSSVAILSVICFFGAALLGIYMMLRQSNLFIIPTWKSFYCICANGILSQIIGWWLITKGIKDVKLSLSGVLMLTQPVITFVIDCVFLHRNTLLIQQLGCATLIAAIYIIARLERKKEQYESTKN